MSPVASVIIPCYNAEKTVAGAIESLSRQAKKGFEVIVVDDGSRDNTLAEARKAAEDAGIKAVFISQKNTGPAFARNLGARKATAKTIIFLDSDCICPKNWFGEIIAPLKKGYSACLCPYKTANTQSWVARYIGYEIGERQERTLDNDIDAAASYSLAVNRKDFLDLGGFDASFKVASGEDFDFSFKLVEKGKKIFFTSRTFVWHRHPESLVKFLRQQFKRGYWRVLMYSKNRVRATKKESYVGYQPQMQFALANLAILSALLSIAFLTPVPIAVSVALLYFSNFSLGLWSFKREKKFLFIAPFIASVRSFAGLFGVYKFFFDRAFK